MRRAFRLPPWPFPPRQLRARRALRRLLAGLSRQRLWRAAIAQPVVYVINGAGTRHQPVLMRKGSRERPGAKMLAVNPGREIGTTGSLARSASGPRMVEVTARRGL